MLLKFFYAKRLKALFNALFENLRPTHDPEWSVAWQEEPSPQGAKALQGGMHDPPAHCI